LPGRERCRTACRRGNDGEAASGASARTSSLPASWRTMATTAKPAHTERPTCSDAACQAVSATRAPDTSTSAAARTQSLAVRTDSSRSKSDGLTSRTCSSGTMENNSETSAPIATPCTAALRVTPYSASARSGAPAASVADRVPTARCARPTPSRLPATPSAITCSRYAPMIRPLVAPRHFSTAMLFSFCSTNTRVTLETAMPPRITMTRPTRLR